MKTHLKLGTRRSLLARAQSGWVAREIERANPGVRVELVGIETRGDRILDVPLRQVEGKEFFVKELDDAILAGQVDLTVHSFKDLSLERPPGIRLAAVPKREDPRDVILLKPRKGARTWTIGTSSPRRLENLPSFLKAALPAPAPGLEWKEIRGNVNTRLSRVHEADDSEKRLDGVVLALAGLARLWADAEARIELERLLAGVDWVVAPLRESPSAPAQGALAIECRTGDAETLALIRRIHDTASEDQVRAERAVLEEFGGGCHQRFGASALDHPELGHALQIRGKNSQGQSVDGFRWKAPAPSPRSARAWNGLESRAAQSHATLDAQAPAWTPGQAVFVAHWRALPESWIQGLKAARARVWTSGFSSWKELAKRGLQVEGCAEGFGAAFIERLLGCGPLRLPALSTWTVLTHADAEGGWDGAWKGARVIPTYRVTASYDDALKARLKDATHVFWSSESQYGALKELAPKGVHHACGPGKTAQALRRAGVASPAVFPDAAAWNQWIQGE